MTKPMTLSSSEDISNPSSIGSLRGSIVAIVTPMTTTGDIHWDDLEALLNWHVEAGTSGVVIAGTTGECATFSIDEQATLFTKSARFLNGRIPLIAGTGSNCTAESIELTHAAKEAGANATLTVVPYYNKPSQEGMYQHFMAQADAVKIPQILYNVPGRSGCDLTNETVLRLAKHPNIQGLKDATGDLLRAHHLIVDLNAQGIEDFMLYSGDDISSVAFMQLGGQGCISVTANIKPREMASMARATAQQDWAKAALIDRDLRFWHKNLFIESSPAPTKYALWKLGKIQFPDLRLPLVRLSDPCARVIDSGLQ